MAVAAPARLRGDLTRLMHRSSGVREYSLGAARILARAVPFDGVCLITMDPATMLPTGEVVENALPGSTTPRMTEIEIGGEDVNAFTALRASGRLAASLSQATRGDLDRSIRHQELRQPNGFGDELRVTLVDDGTAWGGLTLLRAADREPFSPGDEALLAAMSRHLAEGLRRAVLLTTLSGDGGRRDAAGGVVLLAPDGSILRTDAAADAWLADLGDDRPVPAVIAAVGSRARAVAAGTTATATIARARVVTASGAWLTVRGSTLGEQTVVTLEPARPHELAPLIADAYGLTDRERAVTQLVAQGFATSAIAGRLHISEWTVQDHLKAIFEKLGASSRGEVVARLFFDHHAPRLTE